MKLLLAAAASVGMLFAVPAAARVHHSYHHAMTGAGSSGFYTNVAGHHVQRPIRSTGRPGGATAQCSDGSWSFSENHRGTCSHHGGVSHWLN
jgi:hypothetical protein